MSCGGCAASVKRILENQVSFSFLFIFSLVESDSDFLSISMQNGIAF